MCHQSMRTECIVLCIKSSRSMFVHQWYGAESNGKDWLRAYATTIMSRKSRMCRRLGLCTGIVSANLCNGRQLLE